MSERESDFGKGETRKDDPPRSDKTKRDLGKTAIGGANKDTGKR